MFLINKTQVRQMSVCDSQPMSCSYEILIVPSGSMQMWGTCTTAYRSVSCLSCFILCSFDEVTVSVTGLTCRSLSLNSLTSLERQLDFPTLVCLRFVIGDLQAQRDVKAHVQVTSRLRVSRDRVNVLRPMFVACRWRLKCCPQIAA